MNSAFPTSSVIANLDAWNSLDAWTQTTVLRIAAETERAIRSDVVVMENSYNATMRGAGMSVQELSLELTGYFEKIGRQMASEWMQHAGAEGAAILRDLRSPGPRIPRP